MASKYIVTDIDAVESFGGEKPEEGSWKPLRAKLGIETFGVNAFVGRETGSRVIEEHTEEGSAHQELYVVLTGKARFELDGEKIEAKTGSLVFIADPAVKRTAFALEPNTSVLAVGAAKGAVFTPSSWDDPYKKSSVAEVASPMSPAKDARTGFQSLSLAPRISSLSARARAWTSRLRFSRSSGGGSLGS